ncbi:unnamed protein product [Rhizoctonia solani]|uniref:Alphaherpesvirus glycoprotein E domain protein n=1 Tax=Rhizoctonia solani TaxID=456999 RepID=A0A8H3DBW6_9AGAM|nr:unnamed protein product [Rhizoctonia solani]CAE6523659.1 unnamed protein product [Rhizoctonia solani]
MSTTTLPPWDLLTFTFGWNVNVTGTYTLPRCFNTTWQYNGEVNKKVTDPAPSPPYHAVIYAGGYEPYMIPLNNTVTSGETSWIANLPVGPRYGVSMMDSKNYTGGILDQPLVVTPQAGCNVANPLKPSTLDVEVTGNGQCQQAVINVKNGTAPYELEVVRINGRQKTIHYNSSPFEVTLDMSAGVEYYLAVYDSAGSSAVMGSYNILASPNNGCLGEAATVTAGQYSTLYSGGTSTPTSSVTANSAPSKGLATPAVIAIAVAVPIVTIILTALLLWLCYKRNRRQREVQEKLDIDPGVSYSHTSYTPVPTAVTHYTGSYHDVSTTGYYNAPAPVPYPLLFASSDRNTIRTDGDASIPSSTGSSEKRRHLVNPDPQGLGPINAEPFDPSSISGASGSQPGLPPLPPAYSAAS